MTTAELKILALNDPLLKGVRFSKGITIYTRNNRLCISGRVYYNDTFESVRKAIGKENTPANCKWAEKHKEELLWEVCDYKKSIEKRRMETKEKKNSVLFTTIAEKALQTKCNVHDNEYGVNKFTKKEYKYIYEKRIKPFFQNYYTSDINTELVEEWQNWILTKQYDKGFSNYKNDKKQFLSVKSLKNIRVVLNLIFKSCIQKNYMEKNPLDSLKAPRKNKKGTKTVSYLTLDEIKKVFNSFDTYISQANKDYEIKGRKQFKNVFLTMIGSGMRSGEIIGLQWDDIDFENETIYVRRRVRDGDVDLPKSSSSIRKFALLKEAKDGLKAQKELFKDENSKWVFLNRYNNPFKSPQQFDIRYKKVLQISGLNSDRLYSLRHTFATNAIGNGTGNFVVVSAMLGHKDTVVTQQRYVSNQIDSSGLKGKSLFD